MATSRSERALGDGLLATQRFLRELQEKLVVGAQALAGERVERFTQAHLFSSGAPSCQRLAEHEAQQPADQQRNQQD